MAYNFNLGNYDFAATSSASSAAAFSSATEAGSYGNDYAGLGAVSQGLLAIGSAYSQAVAYDIQGAYQRQALSFNQRVAELQAEDALNRGKTAVRNQEKKTNQILGAQRVSLASQGVALDSGTALELQKDTAQYGRLDAIQLKANVWREAWGYRVSAVGYNAQAAFAGIGSTLNQRNTLLTGGLNAVKYGSEAGYYFNQ